MTGVECGEVDESLNSSLSAGLSYHPRPLLMHLTELEVAGEKVTQCGMRWWWELSTHRVS